MAYVCIMRVVNYVTIGSGLFTIKPFIEPIMTYSHTSMKFKTIYFSFSAQ